MTNAREESLENEKETSLGQASLPDEVDLRRDSTANTDDKNRAVDDSQKETNMPPNDPTSMTATETAQQQQQPHEEQQSVTKIASAGMENASESNSGNTGGNPKVTGLALQACGKPSSNPIDQERTNNEGNDRVTVDNVNGPLEATDSATASTFSNALDSFTSRVGSFVSAAMGENKETVPQPTVEVTPSVRETMAKPSDNDGRAQTSALNTPALSESRKESDQVPVVVNPPEAVIPDESLTEVADKQRIDPANKIAGVGTVEPPGATSIQNQRPKQAANKLVSDSARKLVAATVNQIDAATFPDSGSTEMAGKQQLDSVKKSHVDNSAGVGAGAKTALVTSAATGSKPFDEETANKFHAVPPAPSESQLLGDRGGGKAVLQVGGASTTVAEKTVGGPASAALESPLLSEITIRKLRAPLVETYAPFIAPSDTSLQDARRRLQTAIGQTQQLRAAFTERVYGKYRVCLRPPPSTQETLEKIRSNPASYSLKMQEEIRSVKEEKDIEKKEAQKLNAELAASNTGEGNASVNAESAEQLMFVSAGLSLVILPEEQVADELLNVYKERAPTNQETGQRVRSISAAAAAAGDVMLDRARKGAAMRVERQRRRQLQLLSGGSPEEEAANGYSRLNLLTQSGAAASGRADLGTLSSQVAAPKSAKRPNIAKAGRSYVPPTTAAAKAMRGRVQSSMSVNMLLSLNPAADEINTEGKPSAATSALTSLGIAAIANNKTPQQRLRHPHPESVGGRRRAVNSTAAKKELASLTSTSTPVSNSHLSSALPPLPTLKERRERKALAVLSRDNASSVRAKKAVSTVLSQFLVASEVGVHSSEPPERQDVTEISLLYGIQCIGGEEETKPAHLDSGSTQKSATEGSHDTHDASEMVEQDPVSGRGPIDPLLALSVLQAVGIVQSSPIDQSRFSIRDVTSIVDSYNADRGDREVSEREKDTDPRPIISLRKSWESVTGRKRRFSEAFPSPVPKLKGRNPGGDLLSMKIPDPPTHVVDLPNPSVSESSEKKSPSKETSPLVISIRGGGEVLLGSPDDGAPEEQKTANSGALDGSPSPKRSRGNSLTTQEMQSQADSSGNARMVELQQPQGTQQQSSPVPREVDAVDHRMFWEERPPMAMMNTRIATSDPGYALPAAHPPAIVPHLNDASNSQMAGRLQNSQGRYHHPTANALLLAHQLQHGRSHAGDLSDYIGGLHHATQRPGGYDWGSIGAASAAAVAAAHSSLAALGINRHRAHMAGFTVQDRTRALLAHEQQTAAAAAAAAHAAAAHRQTAAFLGGATGHGYPRPPPGAAGFPHLNAQSADSAAVLLNPGTTAMISHAHMTQANGMSPSLQQPMAHMQVPQQPARSNVPISGMPSKDGKNDDASKGDAGDITRKPADGSRSPQRVVPGKRKSSDLSLDQPTPLEKQHIVTGSPVRLVALKRRKGTSNSESHSLSAAEKISASANQPSIAEQPVESQQATSSRKISFEENQKEGQKLQKQDPLEDTVQPETSSKNPGGAQNGGVAAAPRQEIASSYTAQVNTPKGPGEKNSLLAQNQPSAKQDFPKAESKGTTEDRASRLPKPATPKRLSRELSALIGQGKIHEASEELMKEDASVEAALAVDHLLSLGASVPIPKALVANPLKERLNTPGFKNPTNNGATKIPREVVVASVLVWLWAYHEDSFQRAFSKSGRIDVNPECKWLIQAAVDASVRALTLEIADAVARGQGPLAEALAADQTQTEPAAGPQRNKAGDPAYPSRRLDILTAFIVSKAMMAGLRIDEDMDIVLPEYDGLVRFLDESRICALHCKSRERVVLANLLSRRATMQEQFAHAYVSSMVRAGEALGHADLFEIVQNESMSMSTMIPYDIFTDESGAWEDPCRPSRGFFENLAGDDLVRRAHARAMIHKSLKKLQDRHNIKGGTPTSGPYTDVPSSQTSGNSAAVESSQKSQNLDPGTSTPRGWARRRFSISEPAVPKGTGSAEATSASLYDPRHFSAPLEWDVGDTNNSPYGRHSSMKKSRPGGSTVKPKVAEVPLGGNSQVTGSGLTRGTHEIDWGTIAGIFRPVSVPGGPQAQKESDGPKPSLASKTIFAPICRQVDGLPETSSDESEGEEDLSDEAVLKRHQVVLDRMKAKLSEFLESRKRHQERRKSRSNKG